MKKILMILCLFPAVFVQAQHGHMAQEKPNPVRILPGIGSFHRPVSTTNLEAQKYFDQGFTLIYGFNHEEAIRSFEKAIELDPKLVMAYWGKAYALGPNINLDVDPQREKAAYDAVQKALSLMNGASQIEKDYVGALAKRYSDDPKADLKKLAVDYKDAMKELVSKYPDDLDAATLYAESMMDLRPWQLWSSDGKPAEGTEEIVSVLESVLRRNPNHPGANHYYIHAVEASQSPERALPSAGRLEAMIPAAGHLVHMPAHIYVRTGDYRSAAEANERAIKSDEAFFKLAGGAQGMYPMMYYNHNIHFLYYANSMEGNYAGARKAADQVTAKALPYAKEVPMLDGFVPTSLFAMLRFRKFDEVLKLPSIPQTGIPFTAAVWHYGKGLAFARTGNPEKAIEQQGLFEGAMKEVPQDAIVGLNPAANVLAVAQAHLVAEIALSKGDDSAGTLFEKAVEVQDQVSYDEPPDWYYPLRETLGGYLLRKGKAAEAEQVFRRDLEMHPRNGRSLFGLMESLKAQKKDVDATMVQQQFEVAWKHADTKLRIEDL